MNIAKIWFWVLFDILIGALIVSVAAFGIPALEHYSASRTPAHTVTVTAEGKTTATPNLAKFTFSVVTQGQNPQTLSDNNNTKMNAVMKFLEGQGIATSDIQTVAYNLQPNYQYPRTGTQGVIDGYTLTQSVQLKIHDLSKVASVIGGLAPLGVNQIGSVDFTFSDETSFLAKARADALTKARAEAEQMAKAAGASLGAVVHMSENTSVPIPRTIYAASAMGANVAASTPTIQPGSEDITDNVTITYALQ